MVDLSFGIATGDWTDQLIGIDRSSGSPGDDLIIIGTAGDGDDLVDSGDGVDDLDGDAGTDMLGFLEKLRGDDPGNDHACGARERRLGGSAVPRASSLPGAVWE